MTSSPEKSYGPGGGVRSDQRQQDQIVLLSLIVVHNRHAYLRKLLHEPRSRPELNSILFRHSQSRINAILKKNPRQVLRHIS